MYCVETTDLSYQFSKGEAILNGLNLQVPEETIYGFLGANGAGKTTTLRLLLGLLRTQKGGVNIFGRSFDNERIAILKKTGSMIEAPSFYAQLTAAENLEVWRKIYGCPKKRIESVLKTVGLGNTGRKKAGQFSLGMKQRLGIAVALLNNPALLILDEPTNGLDPAGILEMRDLLKRLNREHGITILISSHLLAELEQVMTHTGIIHKGQMLFQGTVEALQLQQGALNATNFLTSDADATYQLMQAGGLAPEMQPDGKITIRGLDKKQIALLNEQLLRSNIAIYQVESVSHTLESIFINLTKN